MCGSASLQRPEKGATRGSVQRPARRYVSRIVKYVKLPLARQK